MSVLGQRRMMVSLCVGCGSCLGVCPTNTIQVKNSEGILTVSFDHADCINCGKCAQICPALLNLQITRLNRPITLGRIKKIFFGYSADYSIRYHGASGGIVTSLLLYMLKHRIVNEVLVVRMNGFHAEPQLTDDERDVISAQGSIYFKTFSLRILPQIIDHLKNGKSIGIVGLPCQISTLKRTLNGFKGRIYLIGLICNHVNEHWYMEHLFEKYLPKNAKPIALTARKNGWPGKIKISFKLNGETRELAISHNTQFWSLLPSLGISAPLGCLICTDHLASKADIVAGDAWHPKFAGKDSTGASIILARTDKGLKLIESTVKHKILNIEEAKPLDLYIAQTHNIIEQTHYAPFKQKLLQHQTKTIHELKEIDKTITALLLVTNKHLTKHKTIRQMLKTSTIEKILQIILWRLSLHESIRMQKMLKQVF